MDGLKNLLFCSVIHKLQIRKQRFPWNSRKKGILYDLNSVHILNCDF